MSSNRRPRLPYPVQLILAPFVAFVFVLMPLWLPILTKIHEYRNTENGGNTDQ